MIGIKTGVILCHITTPGTTSDVATIKDLSLPKSTDDVCFDAAYASRHVCNILVSLGMKLIIKPKSNCKANAKGSWYWREMVELYMNNREEFDSRYRQSSVIEAVFAALKAMFGDVLRSRTVHNQNVEIARRLAVTTCSRSTRPN